MMFIFTVWRGSEIWGVLIEMLGISKCINDLLLSAPPSVEKGRLQNTLNIFVVFEACRVNILLLSEENTRPAHWTTLYPA